MARFEDSLARPTLSLLDRLVDEDPENPAADRPQSHAQSMAQLKSAVLRDLRWILNARTSTEPGYESEEPEALRKSVRRLGLSDITNLDMKNPRQREQMRRRILEVIEVFEPRLDFVSVGVKENDEPGRTRFVVEGRLKTDPEPMKISFDATVVWRNRTVDVR